MLRIALVCLSSDSGGVEHHVVELAAQLNLAAEVAVVTSERGWLAIEATARGLNVITIPPCTSNFEVRIVSATRAALRRLRPDVVHSHLGRSDWYTWFATAGMHVVRASTEHGISGDRPELYGGPATRFLHRLAHNSRLRRTDVVIAVSRSTASALIQRYPALRDRPPFVVLPGVNTTALMMARHDTITPNGTLRLLCLSRLSHEKGVDVLLRAIARASGLGAVIHAVVAGDGPERYTLGTLAADLGVSTCVDFVGRVQDVAPFLREADALVIPSRSENLPLAALEAITAGVPIVAADVGGVSEVVVPDTTGWLFASEDADAVAGVLCSLGDGMQLQRVRAHLRAGGNRFGADRMAVGVIGAYELGIRY